MSKNQTDLHPSCGHTEEERLGWICTHLTICGTNTLETKRPFAWRMLDSLGFALVCGDCAQLADATPLTRTVCAHCMDSVAAHERRENRLVAPPRIRELPCGLELRHQTQIWEGLTVRPLTVQPVTMSMQGHWIALSSSGELLRLDPSSRMAATIAHIANEGLAIREDWGLHVSPDGEFIAVVETKGSRGMVFNSKTGKKTMDLDRGDYHEDVSCFAIAFFMDHGQSRLIHATDWNRIDVSDPATGALLTDRNPTSYETGEERPAHYLDYFHCSLAVSPEFSYALDDGWLWHPCGVPRVWSLRRWLAQNVWESEDGSSVRDLCVRGYYWDGPVCWISDSSVAVWGIGRDDETLIPAVWIFDAETGKPTQAVPGVFVAPRAEGDSIFARQGRQGGTLAFDSFLFSWDATEGFSAWDIANGARLFHDSSFCPNGYHRATRSFLTIERDGTCRVSRLVSKDFHEHNNQFSAS